MNKPDNIATYSEFKNCRYCVDVYLNRYFREHVEHLWPLYFWNLWPRHYVKEAYKLYLKDRAALPCEDKHSCHKDSVLYISDNLWK